MQRELIQNNNSGIYAIKNKNDGKYYFGSAVNLGKRVSQHRTDLRGGNHKNKHLQRAWNKYGENCFEFKVVFECNKKDLLKEEQFCFDYLRGHELYNINPNATSGLGRKASLSTRMKMSKAMKRFWGSPKGLQAKKSISIKLKGVKRPYKKRKPWDEKVKKKLSISNKGQKRSEKTKRKLREAWARTKHRNRTNWEKRRANGKDKHTEEQKQKISMSVRRNRWHQKI